jgi:GYF domain 2
LEDWYYIDSGKREGPLSLQELLDALATVSNPERLFVWCPRFSEWQAAEIVPELEPLFSPPSSPAPVSQATSEQSYISKIIQPKERIKFTGRPHSKRYAGAATSLFVLLSDLLTTSAIVVLSVGLGAARLVPKLWRWTKTPAAEWLTGLLLLLILLLLGAARLIGPNYTCSATNASMDWFGRYLLPSCNWQPLQSNEKSTEDGGRVRPSYRGGSN